MTSATPVPAASLPRHALGLSVALHGLALLLLPGLGREVSHPDLPALVATLRIVPAVQPLTAPRLTPAREEAPAAAAHPVRPGRSGVRSPAPLPALPAEAPPPSAQPSLPAAAAPEPALPPMADERPAPPAPRPVAAQPSPAAEALALDDYGRALSELLARQQQYPRLAALRGWEGVVRLRLRVAAKGALVAAQVVDSSGHEILDQHALKFIQGTALPAPPRSLGDREIQVVVPIHYKLQRPA